jgi:hypothetical protein
VSAWLFGLVLCARAHYPNVCAETRALRLHVEETNKVDCYARLNHFQEIWDRTPKFRGKVWAFCRPLETDRA